MDKVDQKELERQKEEEKKFIKERKTHEKEVTEKYMQVFGNKEKKKTRFLELYYCRDFKYVVDDFVKLLSK